MIKDKNIEWNVRREFIPAAHMLGLSVDRVSSLGAGAAVFQEVVAAAELSGLAINQAGDEIYHLWKLPWDMDRGMPIQARIWFIHASTDADTPDWVIEGKGLAAGEAMSDGGDTPDFTLTFPAKAVAAVANALEKTSWQVAAANLGLTDIFAQLMIECNGLGSASADEISLLGIEIAYTIAACGESSKRDDTDLTLDNLTRY